MAFVVLGLLAGICSGLIGLGGGVIVVPALVLFFGLSQHTAQGTTLAMMIPPIGLLATWAYYQQGYVDLKIAGFLIIGFIVGGFLGAKIALLIPKEIMQKLFGITVILIGIRMLIK